MKSEIKKLPKSLIEIQVELSPEEMKPLLEQAATRLQANKPIAGFRPGKAPYDVVVKQFTEMVVWQEAAEEAVQKHYSQIVIDNKFQTIGSPHIDVVKLAPNNPFIFKATAPLLPEVKLGDLTKIKVEKKVKAIEDKNVDKVLDDLRKMQTKEVISVEPLAEHGKVVIDMDISIDNVPIEGGQTKGHSVYMDEDYYIPGIKEKVLGIKKGEIREFKLPFPSTHYNKTLAGREADFKVTATEVFELQKPPIDDELAKTLGQKSLDDLRVLVRHNLEEEQKHRDEEAFELEVLEKVTAAGHFGDIPEILINDEAAKMLAEFKVGLSRQNMEIDDYLKKLNKTIDQLKLDFAPEAVKRVKTALLLRLIAEEQKINVEEKEIDAEVERMLKLYQHDNKAQENIRSPGARDWLANSLASRKVIEWLKEKVKA